MVPHCAEVGIKQDANGYDFVWKIGDIPDQDRGDHAAGKCSSDRGDSCPAIYRLAGDGSLVGTWSNGNASEVRVPVRYTVLALMLPLMLHIPAISL